jgi:hypothetical protein
MVSEKEIKLTREMKIYLLTSIKKGYIEIEEIRNILGLTNLIFNVQVIDNGIPFASNEDEIEI